MYLKIQTDLSQYLFGIFEISGNTKAIKISDWRSGEWIYVLMISEISDTPNIEYVNALLHMIIYFLVNLKFQVCQSCLKFITATCNSESFPLSFPLPFNRFTKGSTRFEKERHSCIKRHKQTYAKSIRNNDGHFWVTSHSCHFCHFEQSGILI